MFFELDHRYTLMRSLLLSMVKRRINGTFICSKTSNSRVFLSERSLRMPLKGELAPHVLKSAGTFPRFLHLIWFYRIYKQSHKSINDMFSLHLNWHNKVGCIMHAVISVTFKLAQLITVTTSTSTGYLIKITWELWWRFYPSRRLSPVADCGFQCIFLTW